jgi:Protein of unknown function (DUF3455)
VQLRHQQQYRFLLPGLTNKTIIIHKKNKKMKKNNFKRIILAPVAAAVLLVACKKEKEPAAVDTDSPAYKISQSEKLIIPAEVDLPANAPGGNTRVATYYAEGVQKYKAQATSTGGYDWVFVAPKADLFDASSKKIGTHGAGPYWAIPRMQSGVSDSIFAQQFSPAKTATPDAGSIPWLQLMPKAGKTPTGIFADVDYIQRIATTGGKAPAMAPQSATDTADVFYTAIYRFSKRN